MLMLVTRSIISAKIRGFEERISFKTVSIIYLEDRNSSCLTQEAATFTFQKNTHQFTNFKTRVFDIF